ncbi:MAG: GNAT family N-acetyltransferase [Solibacillus sp.]|uniref:GNAT family N-acetyltransferase n=1 Tax=unclassified Solibacillus TaxID=2637870 RepID=UPI0030F7D4D5
MKKMEKKYIPLAQFFELCTQNTFTLTYDEIQNIMGHELPNAAYLNLSWWKKTKAPSTHYFAWTNSNYQVVHVNLGHSVTFSCAQLEESIDQKAKNTFITRQIEANDARAFINLQEEIFSQSEFGYYAPEEQGLTVQHVRKKIAEWRKQKTSTILLCIYDGKFAGYSKIIGNEASRTKHIASVRIAILDAFKQKGLAEALLKETEKWARANNISRLEANIMAHNEAAVKLFNKMNYQTEGTRKNAVLLNDEFIDEIHCSKIIK